MLYNQTDSLNIQQDGPATLDSATISWLKYIYIPKHFTIEHIPIVERPVLGNKTGKELVRYFKSIDKANTPVEILPISSVWKTEHDFITETRGEESHSQTKSDLYVEGGIVILLIAFFLFSFKAIAAGVGRAFRVVVKPGKNIETTESGKKRAATRTAAFFLSLCFCFALALRYPLFNSNLSSPVWQIFIGLAGGCALYLLIKSALLYILDYVNKTSVFSLIARGSYNYLIIFSLLFLLGDFSLFLFDKPADKFLKIWIFLSFGLCVLLYILFTISLARKNKLHPFSYILYLCVLEFLPILLISKIFLSDLL